MSLAKTDRAIADATWPWGTAELADTILAEFDPSVSILLQVLPARPASREPGARRAVELRNPYVDALSHLQLRALTALRSGDVDEERDRMEELLLLPP